MIQALGFPLAAFPPQLHEQTAQAFVSGKGNPDAGKSEPHRNCQNKRTECGDKPHRKYCDYRWKDGVSGSAQAIDDYDIEGSSQLYKQIDKEQRCTNLYDHRIGGEHHHQIPAYKQRPDADGHGNQQRNFQRMHADAIGRVGVPVADVVADQNLCCLCNRVGKDIKEDDDVGKIGFAIKSLSDKK